MNDEKTKAIDRAWNMTCAARNDLLRAENVVKIKQAVLDRQVRELQNALRDSNATDVDIDLILNDGLRSV